MADGHDESLRPPADAECNVKALVELMSPLQRRIEATECSILDIRTRQRQRQQASSEVNSFAVHVHVSSLQPSSLSPGE